jgi:hypothetical protein
MIARVRLGRNANHRTITATPLVVGRETRFPSAGPLRGRSR